MDEEMGRAMTVLLLVLAGNGSALRGRKTQKVYAESSRKEENGNPSQLKSCLKKLILL